MTELHVKRNSPTLPSQRQWRDLPITATVPFPKDSPRSPGRRAANQQWVCFFNGRAGGRAQAVFGSKEEARQFAERHARSILPSSGMSLQWEEANDPTMLITQLGDYAITLIGDG